MFSREEQKQLNTEFWDRFRKKMRNHKSSNGRGINWINYPSDVKDVYIRLEADSKGVRFCFDIQPKDDGIRSIIWEQMTELKVVMETEIGKATGWNESDHQFNGRTVSRIVWEAPTLNFYNKKDHAAIETFLESKLIHFDVFYQEFKDILINLVE
ncbi:MAG: DUF4268 domain-containing protein [Crocinitomicaceae bacterium]|jgi:hypothetical protein|nr:DUF4268 domain-containing protein [Crocinitomicaceae bacterium]